MEIGQHEEQLGPLGGSFGDVLFIPILVDTLEVLFKSRRTFVTDFEAGFEQNGGEFMMRFGCEPKSEVVMRSEGFEFLFQHRKPGSDQMKVFQAHP